MKLFRQAANQGLADAQNNLGLMYTIGEGVPEDHKKAMKMLTVVVAALTDSAQPNPTAPAIQLIYAFFTLLMSSIFNFILKPMQWVLSA